MQLAVGRITRVGLLAVVYVIVAKLGLLFDAVSGFATLVWPATGIAIASLVVVGRWLWPAIFIGAFAVNVWTGAPIVSALGIACGNTIEAVLAASLLLRWRQFHPSLTTPRSVICIVVVAVVSTVTSATIGSLSLFVSHVISTHQAFETWRAWWVGDLLGALVVAPFLLTWWTASPGRSMRSFEALATALAVLGTSWLVLGPTFTIVHPFQQVYAVFPVLTWAAVRFGPRGAASATFAVSAIAIASTSLATGPFARETLRGGLMALQVFVGFTAATFLVVAALAAERSKSARDSAQRERELETAVQSTRVAREQAEQASLVKTNFLSMVSHDLRAPLATLLLQIEQLKLESHDDPERRHLADGMYAQGQRLHHLIDGLLDYARIQSGKLVLQVEDIDPRELLGGCIEELQPQAELKGLTLEVNTSAGPERFTSDRQLLRLIVINLIGNALKFTQRGGVTITLGGDAAALVVAVRDTGPGIPIADQQRVFEPFEQIDPVRSKHIPGVGLGLALVHEMVDALDGKISLESTVGQGSTFVVALPSIREGHSPHRR